MFSWADHTGELELHVEAATPAAVLAEALCAIGELLGGEEGERTRDAKGGGQEDAALVERELAVEAADRPALLAAWIDELVFLAETEGLVPIDVAGLRLDGDRLSATVIAREGEPPHLVKGATFHRLAFERSAEGGYHATVVLDV
jgi:SHS2 domain-containing protein